MANTKQPQSVTMETGPVICGRCGLHMFPLVLEEIEGIVQLRAGKVLITKIEARCLTPNCGWLFYWSIREKDVEKMTITYEQVLKLYNPE